jgi:hypothetical protein
MFYALLILPHLLALVGLAVFAYRTGAAEPCDDDYGGWGGSGRDQPPRGPEPPPPFRGLPLGGATAPRRRLRVGERLSELYPRRSRRAHGREQPARPREG